MVFLALFALAAASVAPDDQPITVTGHAWAPFISPMGEPFRSRGATDDPLARWFHSADQNRDGRLDLSEMTADAVRFFALLDENGDGEIGPTEMSHYEWEIAPDIQAGAKTRYRAGDKRATTGGATSSNERRHRDEEAVYEGAARYSLLNLPQPVAAADVDFDRDVTLDEFRRAAAHRFQLLDRSNSGALTLATLAPMLPGDPGARAKRKKDYVDPRLGSGLPTSN